MKRLAICPTLSLFAAKASALELSFGQESRALVAVGVPEQAPPAPGDVLLAGFLYEAHGRTGVVRFRRLLPGACTGLAVNDDQEVTVTVDPSYRSIYTKKSDRAAEPTLLTYTPGQHVRGAEVTPVSARSRSQRWRRPRGCSKRPRVRAPRA